ncbi:hypothetical protein BLL61_03825 [Lacticaseibacillus casei]|nr:hypothetical protein BLL61_03825 [Lacticaseibacillus casei]
MSNETKRDVFNDLVEQHQNYVVTVVGDYGVKDKAIEGWNKRYSAALPDDLPVIPEDVSEWLTWCKRKHHSLKDGLDGETRVSVDRFARAWVLGVWRVEETGEVVKL